MASNLAHLFSCICTLSRNFCKKKKKTTTAKLQHFIFLGVERRQDQRLRRINRDTEHLAGLVQFKGFLPTSTPRDGHYRQGLASELIPFVTYQKCRKTLLPAAYFSHKTKSFAHFDPGVVILGVKESESQCRRSACIWNSNLEAQWKARPRLEVCWGHVYDQCHLVWREGYCSHIASLILWRIFYQIFCLFVPQKKRLLTFPQQHSLKKLNFKARPFFSIQPWVTACHVEQTAYSCSSRSTALIKLPYPFLCKAAHRPVTWWLNKLSLYCSCYRHHNVSRHPSTAPAVRGSMAQR